MHSACVNLRLLKLSVFVLVASAFGCSPPKPSELYKSFASRYVTLCEQGCYVEAAFEYEYGSNHVGHAARERRERGFIPGRFPLKHLVVPLKQPENIGELAKLVEYGKCLPRGGPPAQELFAKLLGKSEMKDAQELLRYYRQNEGRLRWDDESKTFRIVASLPSGRKLPKGFVPVEDSGLASDGYPRRILCQKDGSEMVYVPHGKYWVSEEEGWREVLGFYIDRLEVTNEQYLGFCRETNRGLPKYERRMKGRVMSLEGFDKLHLPVTCIRWKDANDYADWAGKSLPTEDEWLRAAKGETQLAYPWGDLVPAEAERDQYAIFGRKWPEEGGKPSPVRGRDRGASPFGAEDMAGNVEEYLAGRTVNGAYLCAGGWYGDAWAESTKWDTVWPCRAFLLSWSEARPWRGFRCVLVVGR